MKLKKILGLILTTAVLFTTIAGCENSSSSSEDNKNEDTVEDNDNGSTLAPENENSKYLNYRGKITEINLKEEKQIIVEGKEEDAYDTIAFNLTNDAVIVSYTSKNIIDINEFEKGDKIEVIYNKKSPMTKSLPPITKGKILILRDSDNEPELGVKLSTFNEDLISEDNSLQLIINDDTSIVSLDGKDLTKEDIVTKEVLVFYGPAMTLSIPGQSNAKKIILL